MPLTKSAWMARDDRFIASSMIWIFSFSTGLSGSKYRMLRRLPMTCFSSICSPLFRQTEAPGQFPDLFPAVGERRLGLDHALPLQPLGDLGDLFPGCAVLAPVEVLRQRTAGPLPAGLGRFGRVADQQHPHGDPVVGNLEQLL